jgi:uncharacterized membrane protein YfcA
MTLPHYPPSFWLAATGAAILVGLAKAGFGGGPVLLATPLLALTIPIAEATALLLPLLILADFLALRHYRREYDATSLKVLLPSALVGIVLGGLFFGLFSSNERILQIGIGLLALFFVLFRVGQTLIYGAVEGRRFPRPVGLLIGTTAGFTSTLVHAGGPLVTMYLLPQRLPRNIFVGTTVITFIMINVAKLLPYGILGLLRVGDLATILILSPLVYVGVRLGLYLNHRVTEKWFNAVIYFFLLLAAIQLISGRSIVSLLLG